MVRLIPCMFVAALLAGCGKDIPTRVAEFVAKGNEAFALQNYEEATRYYQEAVKLDSCSAEAWNNLGSVAYQQTKYGLAVEDYTQAIGCEGDFFDAILNRANTYYAMGGLNTALYETNRMIWMKPDTAVVYFLQGLIYTKMTAFDKADSAFRKCLSLDTTNVETYINLGTVLYYEAKYEQARRQLEQALRAQPANKDALNSMALVQCAEGQYGEALRLINEALQHAPLDAWVLNNRAYIYLKMDALDSAAKDIDESISLDATNPWAYRNKGLYFLRKKQYASAVRLLQRSVENESFVADAYLFLGDAYAAMDSLDKACRAWSKERFDPEATQRMMRCRK